MRNKRKTGKGLGVRFYWARYDRTVSLVDGYRPLYTVS